MTGIVLFSTTVEINPAPPLGIRTSIYSCRRIISVATALLVSSTSRIRSWDNLALRSPALITCTIALLELIASLPPRRITAFPVLKHSPNFFPIRSPFGRFFMERTSPIGSESPAICLKPSAIASIRAWVSLNLS